MARAVDGPPTLPAARRKRLPAAERETLIVREAIAFFAEQGFQGNTRELARRIGITQPLLYRYFPTKEALVERVFDEVFTLRWNPLWETWLEDRSQPLHDRLVRVFQGYSVHMLSYEWVRLFLFSGLAGLDLNRRFLLRMRDRVFVRIIVELRHLHHRPPPADEPIGVTEHELVWGLVASIFYIGMRRWVYGLGVPDDIDAVIEDKVRAFLEGAPAAIAARANRPASPQLLSRLYRRL
jgi:AcrR family transcriptional regulator